MSGDHDFDDEPWDGWFLAVVLFGLAAIVSVALGRMWGYL